MVKTICVNEFKDLLNNHYLCKFTNDGLGALYHYLRNLEEAEKKQYVLDAKDLCSKFKEFPDLEQFVKDFNNVKDMETLRSHTTVIEFKTGMLVEDY